jgi:hypothetical protein
MRSIIPVPEQERQPHTRADRLRDDGSLELYLARSACPERGRCRGKGDLA